MIDLRSDTTTMPGPEMIRAMAASPVGDDNFGEDPTTNRLEEYCADLFGGQAAMFTPSGTMSNQIALRVHTRPGDDVVLDARAHYSIYESAPSADLAGVSMNTVHTEDGVLTPELIEAAADARCRDPRYGQVRLALLENTINFHAGRVVRLEHLRTVSEYCRAEGLRVHLDGARLFNAIVASGTEPRDYGELADTLSVCFAKGLGAPFGSILVGGSEAIEEARYYRKSYGGSMHQSGFMAGAALYALRHNVERLAEDHEHARILYTTLLREGVPASCFAPVDTNIIIMDLARLGCPAEPVAADAAREGVLAMAISRFRLRLVTHLGVGREDVTKAAPVVARLIREHSATHARTADAG